MESLQLVGDVWLFNVGSFMDVIVESSLYRFAAEDFQAFVDGFHNFHVELLRRQTTRHGSYLQREPSCPALLCVSAFYVSYEFLTIYF